MNSPRKDLLKKRHYNFDLGPLVKGMRFYWVPLILLLVPILYIMGYGMHFYSAEPEYFLGTDEVLASSFSGYELAKMGVGGQITLGFWVFSLALLVVSAILLSLYPIFRGVKYCNIVFGIPWVFFTILTPLHWPDAHLTSFLPLRRLSYESPDLPFLLFLHCA